MSHHLYKEILQRQWLDFQGSRLLRRIVEDITCYKASNRILTDDIEISGCGLHIFLKPTDTKCFCFNRLQCIKEADASFINNDQFLNGLCDFLDDVGGYDNHSRMFLKTLCQHIVKFHTHNSIEAQDRFV